MTCDVLARPVRAYAYAYPFVELAVGVAYLARLAPVVTSIVILVVMLVSVVGVTQALLQRRRIQCACLRTVFNLPMTKMTFVEDALMAGMALAMLVGLWAEAGPYALRRLQRCRASHRRHHFRAVPAPPASRPRTEGDGAGG